jgi:hypothetical protein
VKKALAFVIGLLTIPVGYFLIVLTLIPLVGIPINILAVFIVAWLYRWMTGRKPETVLTQSGMTRPADASVQEYKYGIFEINLYFASGLLTAYLLITASDAEPAGTWLTMALVFLPVYLVTIPIIITTLFRINRLKNHPDWLTDGKTTKKSPKTPVILRISTVVTVLAIISMPVISQVVSTNHGRRLEKKYQDEEMEEKKEIAATEAVEMAELQKRLDAKKAEDQQEADRLAEEIASSVLSAEWKTVSIESSPFIRIGYPGKWGSSTITKEKNTDPGYERETHMIEFSGNKTPVLLVFNGSILFNKNTGRGIVIGAPLWSDVVGYNFEAIANTEYKIKIQLKDADYPELCLKPQEHTKCYAGQFAADFNKLVNSAKPE